MITFSNLGKQGYGNLGNQLFQIASCIGIAKSKNTGVGFPEWKYEKYFENELPYTEKVGGFIKEKHFHYDLKQFNDDCDITGWMQSEKYFEKEEIKKQFTFKEEYIGLIEERFSEILKRETIAISVRRGDYINNETYTLLPASYYIGALLKHFPNYKNYNIILFSDDIEYCKLHFGCLDNVYFSDGSDIEQLCLISLCDHFIIANSTFSWWGAWLGEKQNSKVICPNYLFGYEYGLKNNAKDFYPERWIKYDHKKERIDLSDVTFIIPVHYDHEDRKENLDLILKNLKDNYDCKIIVGEQGSVKFTYVDCVHVAFDYPHFHRTKMLNVMSSLAGTPIVINYDADVLIPPLQIIEAVNRIRSGVDFVYPYDGRFARVPRKFYNIVKSFNDVGMLKGQDFKGTREEDMRSFGGCVAYSKESFFNAGAENEKFISWASEDWERVERYKKLDYKVERVNGVLFHFDHFTGINSSTENPFHEDGLLELRRIQKMNGEQLRREVDGWGWATSLN